MVRIRISRGFDLPMKGAATGAISQGPSVQLVALSGADHPGLRPRFLVAEGDSVALGQPLLEDKHDPRVRHTAPGTGTVQSVDWGPRRTLGVVSIRLSDARVSVRSGEALSEPEIDRLAREGVVSRLAETGLWTAFRTRPFSRVPPSDSEPKAIFVTAIDTQPLAPDPSVIIGAQLAAFRTGLRVLARLTEGTLWLCTGPALAQEPMPDIGRLRRAVFSGPHPAGLPGTHIHHLDPVGCGRTVWHVGYQDVIAIGRLFGEGVLSTERVVALCGAGIIRPRLVRTRAGASLEDLTAGGTREAGPWRILSGSALGGRHAASGGGFLGRYHNQVTVLPEGGRRRFLGWLGPVTGRHTAFGAAGSRLWPRRQRRFTTARNGRFGAMLPMHRVDQVLPLDILPWPLLRAFAVRDTDRATALGCLELDEEDLALCSYLCPAKTDYGRLLRGILDLIERGA